MTDVPEQVSVEAPIVDAHAHIYHTDETRYPMIQDPYRPPPGFGHAEHLQSERQAHGIDRVVLVQTGSAYQWDNRLLVDTARDLQDWATGVCNLDPASSASPAAFADLVRTQNVRALRLESTQDGRYDHEGARQLMAAAGVAGAVVCAHLRPQFLPELSRMLDHFPEVAVVLDHSAYPDGAEGPDSDTVRAVVELARHQNLHTKLTFLVTGSAQDWPFVDTQAIAHRILDAFGPARCLWGSGFPCELWMRGKATYGQHLALIRDELGLSPTERADVLGGTAMRLFF